MTDMISPAAALTGVEGDAQRASLLNLMEEASEKYQFKADGRLRTQAILAMLTSEVCERRVGYMLANQRFSF